MNAESLELGTLLTRDLQTPPVTVKEAIELYDQHHLSTCKDVGE